MSHVVLHAASTTVTMQMLAGVSRPCWRVCLWCKGYRHWRTCESSRLRCYHFPGGGALKGAKVLRSSHEESPSIRDAMSEYWYR